MPKDLGSALNHVFTVLGASTNPDVVAILTNPELSKIQLPDALVTDIETKLFSEGSAKSKFFPKWKAEDLNGLDAHVIRLAEAKKFTAEEIEELKNIKGSSQKAERFVELAEAKMSAEAKAQYSGKDSERQKLIDDLNALKISVAEKEKAFQKQLSDKDLQVENHITNLQARTFISQYADRLNLPKEMDAEVKMDIVMNAINREAETKGISFKRNGANLEVLDKNGSKYFDNSIEQTYKHIVEGVLSRNNLLKTTQEPTPPAPPANPIPGQGKPDARKAEFMSDLDKRIAEAEGKN